MKQIYNCYRLLLATLIISVGLQAQDQRDYAWEVGAGIGSTNYYGDVSPYRIHHLKDIYRVYRFLEFNRHYINRPSFTLLAHKKLNSTIGILVQANALQFSMSDRYRRANGDLKPEALNFARSLNFQTNLYDVGFAVTINSNNGKVFKEDARIYPSVHLGVGFSTFSVKGDLYDNNGAPYDYTFSGRINDNKFETDLRDLNTEEGGKYSQVAPYLNAGIALNFQLSRQFRLALQSDMKYSGSDYLDDVSKTYKANYPTPAAAYAARPGYNVVNPASLQRGDNNGVNDIYINNRVVLVYSFGNKKRKADFKAPVVYAIRRSDIHRVDSVRSTRQDTMPSLIPRQRYAADKQRLIADSTRKADSMQKTARMVDSLVQLTYNDTSHKRAVDNRLDAIQRDLRDIKTVIRNQALIPRYQHLQFQHDSVARLSERLHRRRNVTGSDRLQQRVYELQKDSLKNEMRTIMWMSQYPANELDSSLLVWEPAKNNKSPITIYDPSMSAEQDNIHTDTAVLYVDSVMTDQYTTQLRQLKTEERYRTDSAYRHRIDSLEKRILSSDQQIKNISQQKADSLDNQYRSKLERLQARLDSLQAEELRKDTATTTRGAQTVDTIARTTTVTRPVNQSRNTSSPDTVQVQRDNTRDRVQPVTDSAITDDEAKVLREALNSDESPEIQDQQLDSLQTVVRKNSAALESMQLRLKGSRDSAAYYRRTLYARDINDTDTIVEKRRWYERIIPLGRKQREQEENADEARILRRQEAYFEDQTKKMNRDIDQLQRANRNLENDYDRLRRQRNNRIVASTPSVVFPAQVNNNNQQEINDLREEIAQLRTQLLVPDRSADKTPPTVYVPPTPQIHRDSTQMASLRADLVSLQKELDSIRRTPAPVSKPPQPVHNVNSFPVISVYFAMNAATLPLTQTDKIAPMVAVAKHNQNAKIVLKGFADAVGNATVNRAIAIKRVDYVKNLLVTRFGLPAAQIVTEDPEIPVVKGARRANPLDRRVDLQFK
jgi:outer membrane protein OmpA-like peptidoglycan-associated protein